MRAKPINASAEGAWEDGKSEVESLKEEIGEWKDNLEGNNMEHLPKYEEVSECADTMESALDTLEGIDFPECLSDVPVNYTQDTRQSAQSRNGRLSNALSALYASKEAGEAWLEENPELELVDLSERDEEDQELDEGESDDQQAVDARESDRSAVEEFINEMDNAIGELENVSFPGMY
jgi:hypothetical protein